MSNSELLHIKDDNEELSNSEVLKRPTFNFQTECQDSVAMSSDSHSQGQENEDDKQEEHLQGKIVLSKQSDSGTTWSRVKNKVEDEEDEGFRTPTSLDHRIPVTKQCPHAPRKPKPSLKRKPPCNPVLDLSKEVVELLLPTQLFNSHQTTKKVRRE